MRRAWPFLIIVAAAGGDAGVAIAGRSQPADRFIVDPASIATTTSELDLPVTSVSSAPTPTSTTGAIVTMVVTDAPVDVPATSGNIARDPRVVVANATNRPGVATRTADLLRALGWDRLTPTDASRLVDDTAVFYRLGFEAAAAQVANDLGVPDADLAPIPDDALTFLDDAADVVALIGSDLA